MSPAGAAAAAAGAATEGAAAIGAEELIGALAGAGGGGEVGLSLEQTLDLSHAYNRVVDWGFDIFTEATQFDMDTYACAYPANFGEAEAAEAQRLPFKWHTLEFPCSEDTYWPLDEMNYTLKASWQGLTLQGTDKVVQFIENASASCELANAGWGWKLYVKSWFGEPNFYGDIASLPLYFQVTVTDGDGDAENEFRRAFQIYASGEFSRFE